MTARHRFFSKAYPVMISGNEIIDINTENDWVFAEFLIETMRNGYEN